MKQLLLIIILFSSLITTAQNSFNPSNQTWIIYSETIACESSSNTECYLVKYPGKNDFEIFNEKIEGFNYVSGTTYTIIVKQEIKQPPIKADESVFKYVLVKVVSAKNEQNSTTNSSSGNNSFTTTIDIDFETIKCESLSNKECLLVKEKNKKEYEIFNGCIYGFTYEAGNRYNLTVSKNNNDYNLIKINKKELVNYNNSKISCTNNRNDNPVLNTNKNITEKPISYHSPLDEKKWFLRMMRENEGSIFEIEENVFSIIFNSFADRFKGTGSCNTFEGIFKTDTKTLFEVDDIVAGFKHCGTEKIEQLFLSRLKECDRFEIKEGKLQLSKQWQILLWFEIENNTKPTLTTTNFTKKESELENSNLKESSSNSESTSSHLYENSKVEEMQKEIEELKKLILAQQKSEEEKSALLAKQKQEVENEIVQKQLAEKQKQDELKKIAAAEAAKAEEISKQKLAKQKEIEDLKKQLAEKEAENKPLKSENNSVETIDNSTTDTENGDKKKNIGDYIITQFSKNTSKIIPDPEFPLRPYFIDGDELKKLERAEANFAIKQKGIYRGQDKQVQIMKEESPIQFIKGNLPRFFVSIEDDDVDPYDVIDLCRADRIGKGRRNFTYAGTKYGGRVKDVTGKLVQLDFKKIRNGLYEIIVDSDLEQGEYAFLPLFSNTQSLTSTNSIKANCFGIVDPEK